ncbi:hypothetical protein DYB32_010381, partial [Aphanomyces invadans]
MQPFIGHLKLPVRRRHRARVQYLSTQRIHESSGKFSLDVVGPTDLSLVANTNKTPNATTARGNPPSTKAPMMVDHTHAPLDVVRVHTRMCGPTFVSVVRAVTRVDEVAYRLDNETASHVLYYRQVGVDSPTNGWKELGPGKSTVYVWAEPLALHQVRPGGGRWATPPPTSAKPQSSAGAQPPTSQYVHHAKQFGYASSLLSERKGLGLDDVEAIHLDVIGLQMALVRPTTTASTATSLGGASSGNSTHSTTPQGAETTKLVNHTLLAPSDLLSKPFLQKPKRHTSYARIENDGVTRVLRVRDTTGLDDEKARFVKEEARVQRLLFHLLALQCGSASTPFSSGHRRTASAVASTRNMGGLDELGGRGGAMGLTLFQSMMEPPPTAAIHRTEAANRALYDRIVPYMTTPVLEDVNQVLIQVVSASGLKAAAPADGGWSNPYCIVTMAPTANGSTATISCGGHPGPSSRFATIASSKLTLAMAKRMEQRTYYIERTMDPVWRDQVFLFEKAHGPDTPCTVQIDVRSHSPLGKHVFLGRAVVGIDGGALAKHVTIKLVGAKAHHVVTGTIDVVVETARTQSQLVEYWYHQL